MVHLGGEADRRALVRRRGRRQARGRTRTGARLSRHPRRRARDGGFHGPFLRRRSAHKEAFQDRDDPAGAVSQPRHARRTGLDLSFLTRRRLSGRENCKIQKKF